MCAVKFLSIYSVDFSNPEIELIVSWGMNSTFSKKIPEPRSAFSKEPKSLGFFTISATQHYLSETTEERNFPVSGPVDKVK